MLQGPGSCFQIQLSSPRLAKEVVPALVVSLRLGTLRALLGNVYGFSFVPQGTRISSITSKDSVQLSEPWDASGDTVHTAIYLGEDYPGVASSPLLSVHVNRPRKPLGSVRGLHFSPSHLAANCTWIVCTALGCTAQRCQQIWISNREFRSRTD